MGILLAGDLGRYAESFEMYETSVRLDPLSAPALQNYVGMLINRNRLAEAERELEKLASVQPGFYASMRGYLTSLGGKWANEALGYLDALQINPESNVARRELAEQFAKIGLEKEALNISEYTSPRVLTMLGRPRDAVTTAQARVSEDPIFLGRRHSLGLALAGAGDYGRARPILEELWQSSGGRVTKSGLFRAAGAAALIAIRRDTDEEADVSELVAAIRDDVRRHRETGITALFNGDDSVNYYEGFAAYLTGEREEGLALIAKGAEDGMFIPQREAYLQTLYDDPGFAPIRASQEARQARERDRFLAVVCTDNPYAAVWQPAAETCEPFAVAGGN